VAVRALLLDFDGTMVDTESVDWRSWEEVFAQHGVEVPRERFLLRIGTLNGPDELDELDALLDAPVDREAVQAARRARERELIAEEPLRPGVDRLLEEARELGLQVAIVSSSSVEWVQSHLARLAIEHHVGLVLCADGDRDRCKPSPALYLEALDRLGARADEAIALEDSTNGVAAAKAAGIFCVAFPNPVTSGLDFSAADLVVHSLDELSLAELVEDAAA
jgi:HAD superfamily hydrolase (TIGR01509 family)